MKKFGFVILAFLISYGNAFAAIPPTLFYDDGILQGVGFKQDLQTGMVVQMSGTIANIFSSVTGGGADGVGYDEVLEEGVGVAKQAQINFIGTSATCVDNAGATRTDCTFTGGTGVTDATFFVTQEHADLTDEAVLGTAPTGGDIGGTWTTMTVTSVQSNSVDISDDTNLNGRTAIILEGDSLDFAGGSIPSGDLGGTWTSPTVDDNFLRNDADDSSSGGLTLTGIVATTSLQTPTIYNDLGEVNITDTLDMNVNAIDNATTINASGQITASGLIASVTVQTRRLEDQTDSILNIVDNLDVTGSGTFGGTGTSTFSGIVNVNAGYTSAVVFGTGATVDPCETFSAGTIFYNTTSSFFCFCDGTNDLRMTDILVSCF